MGLSVVRIKIDTGGSVEKNANLIKYEVEHAPDDRKVVLIGHSKVCPLNVSGHELLLTIVLQGAVDAAAALSLYPNLFTYVRCFISLQVRSNACTALRALVISIGALWRHTNSAGRDGLVRILECGGGDVENF